VCREKKNLKKNFYFFFYLHTFFFVTDVATLMDVALGRFGARKIFGVGRIHKAHAEISAKITENGHFGPKIENTKICILGTYNTPPASHRKV